MTKLNARQEVYSLMNKLKGGAGRLVGKLQPRVISPVSQPAPTRPNLSYRANEVKRAVLKPFAQAQTRLESAKQFNLPQVNPRVNQATQINTRFGPIQPVQMARDVVNAPYNFAVNAGADAAVNVGRTISGRQLTDYNKLKSPATRLGYNLGSLVNRQAGRQYGVRNTPQQFIGNAAGAIEGPLSVYGGGRILGMGRELVKNVGKQTFVNTLKRNMGSGLKIGGAYGGVNQLSENRNETLPTQLKRGAQGAAIGAGAGVLLGGAFGVAGQSSGMVRRLAARGVKEVFPNYSERQVQNVADGYLRNKIGQFMGIRRKPKPYYKDDKMNPETIAMLDKKFGLDGVNPKSGAIDLNAKIGGKSQVPKGVEGLEDQIRKAKGGALKIPLDKLESSEPLTSGRLNVSETKGPIKVWFDVDTKKFTIEDGHHRVALQRQYGDREVDAVVTPIRTAKGTEGGGAIIAGDFYKQNISTSTTQGVGRSQNFTPLKPQEKILQKAGVQQSSTSTVLPKDGQAPYAQVYHAEPRVNNKIAEKQVKADFDEWEKQVFKQTVSQEKQATKKSVETLTSSVRQNTKPPSSSNVEDMKDITGFGAGWVDVFRNFRKVYGKNFEKVRHQVLDPLFVTSRRKYLNETEGWTKDIQENIVNKLGIKRKSKLSALTQQYGEGTITIAELQKKSPGAWQKAVEADKWFRKSYDQLLDEVNEIRKSIYPTDPTKIIPKRKDYYRHFQEMAQGFAGLKNIFENPASISSGLSGKSEFVKPKSKFLSFAQKRLGLKTDEDAVGGFLDYLRSAMYAKHVDPHIGTFRKLADDLSNATAEGTQQTGKLNNFIEFLQDFSNDLLGKTNPGDRMVQKWIPGGRKVMRVLDWLNTRVKANTIIANAGSTVAQVFNIPQGIASAGPGNSVKGLGHSLASMFSKNSPIGQSVFLKERYFRAYDKFDVGVIENSRKFAAWFTQIGDEMGTKYIWNSHYQKALAEGIQNPVQYADDMARSLVAGRGIGEVPLIQKSKLFQLAAPFQLEVANLWYVLKDFTDQKAFGKIATLFLMNYLFNRAAEKIRGSAVTLDPIQATIDALGELEEGSPMKATGRLAGEVLTNIPGGQTLAAAYPEYGFKVGDTQTPTRKELFGRADPTRFGTGLLLTKGLQDPLYKILPPFGGGQLKKTIEGISAVNQGYSETKTGRVQYPIDQSAGSYAKASVFGKGSLSEAREYYKNQRQPLGDKQSARVKVAGKTEYEKIIKKREINAVKKQAIEAYLDGDIETAKQLKAENGFKMKRSEVVSAAKRRAIDLYLKGDKEGAKELKRKYKFKITRKDIYGD